MALLYFVSDPFDKTAVTLALESGVDGILVTEEKVESVRVLARSEVLPLEECSFVALQSKEDEQAALQGLQQGKRIVLQRGWQVIPVENLLAQSENVWVEVGSLDEAKLACGILERGVAAIVIRPEAVHELKAIVSACKIAQKTESLLAATITKVQPVGLGHRVCVDTLSLLHRGQGMLVGNSSAFTFLVHAETEQNEYVAARPFRINAGGVHAYTRLPHDQTCYLGEVHAATEVLIVDWQGRTSIATVGRVKIEVRPMLLIEAEVETEEGIKKGSVFLQNAETIRLTAPDGSAVSVVSLKVGDTVLCRTDAAGRHFGMRVVEDIQEN
ncbi:MAG: 3-dehydroquinate synthase II family protein [Desulfovibrio sp.]|nr:3-dehydroquinate synthase II family protein [Desulfovibrio sp.]